MIRRWGLTFTGLLVVTLGLLLAGAPAQAQEAVTRGGDTGSSPQFLVIGMVILVLIALAVVLLVRFLTKKMDGDEA